MLKIPWDDYFIKQKVTNYLDDTYVKIVKSVEESCLLNANTIYGKFSDMPIGLSGLLEGCKTLLCINHALKTKKIKQYVFNITSCGGNAINYLITEMAKDVDINCYCEHKDFGENRENIKLKVGNKVMTNIIKAKQEYIAIVCMEYEILAAYGKKHLQTKEFIQS